MYRFFLVDVDWHCLAELGCASFRVLGRLKLYVLRLVGSSPGVITSLDAIDVRCLSGPWVDVVGRCVRDAIDDRCFSSPCVDVVVGRFLLNHLFFFCFLARLLKLDLVQLGFLFWQNLCCSQWARVVGSRLRRGLLRLGRCWLRCGALRLCQ